MQSLNILSKYAYCFRLKSDKNGFRYTRLTREHRSTLYPRKLYFRHIRESNQNNTVAGVNVKKFKKHSTERVVIVIHTCVFTDSACELLYTYKSHILQLTFSSIVSMPNLDMMKTSIAVTLYNLFLLIK